MKMKFALIPLLLAMFVIVSAGDALAYPGWVKISAPRQLKLVKNGDDYNKGDYWAMQFTVTYTNTKNSERIIKAIFDKTLSITSLKPQGSHYVVGSKLMDKRVTINSSKISKMEVWPNGTARLWYAIPLNQIVAIDTNYASSTWKDLNDWYGNEKNTQGFIYKSWSHDFQVRSEKM